MNQTTVLHRVLAAMDPFVDVKKWNAGCAPQREGNSLSSEPTPAKKARAQLSQKMREWKLTRAMRKVHKKSGKRTVFTLQKKPKN